MAIIRLETTLVSIGPWTLIQLPKSASAKLPSRGMTMIVGTFNERPIQVALEPDGKGSHWFSVEPTLLEAAGVKVGDTVALTIEPAKECPEPVVPTDLRHALKADARVFELWNAITPLARWDWIRWIRATSQPETRQRRIGVACSKLKEGERRPCCFNRNLCSEPEVSKNGVLLEPMRV